MAGSRGPLDGLFVLDLSRILAGPTATQLLGDLGATVIKIENPKTGGDDTRTWGPNYARNPDGSASDLSAYFMAANRNKQSVAVDISSDEGQDIVRRLAARADVVIENFRPGVTSTATVSSSPAASNTSRMPLMETFSTLAANSVMGVPAARTRITLRVSGGRLRIPLPPA